MENFKEIVFWKVRDNNDEWKNALSKYFGMVDWMKNGLIFRFSIIGTQSWNTCCIQLNWDRFVSIFYSSIYSYFQYIQHQTRIDFKRVTNSVECMYFENEQKSPNCDVWWSMRYQCMVCEKWCEGKGITNNVLGCIQLWMVMQY